MCWSWAGARAVGTGHVVEGIPCQDAFACSQWARHGAPPVLVAALADGAGSAPQAELGARLAVHLTTDTMVRTLDECAVDVDASSLIAHAVDVARLSMMLAADRRGHPAMDFASTLLVACLTANGGAVGQIGDGAVVVDDGDGTWAPVHWPDHGEFANTTRFLMEPDISDALRIARLDRPARRLAMFSDGLERLLLDFRTRTAHGPFFETIFTRLEGRARHGHADEISGELEDLLCSDRVNARTNDDKALICATCLGR